MVCLSLPLPALLPLQLLLSHWASSSDTCSRSSTVSSYASTPSFLAKSDGDPVETLLNAKKLLRIRARKLWSFSHNAHVVAECAWMAEASAEFLEKATYHHNRRHWNLFRMMKEWSSREKCAFCTITSRWLVSRHSRIPHIWLIWSQGRLLLLRALGRRAYSSLLHRVDAWSHLVCILLIFYVFFNIYKAN